MGKDWSEIRQQEDQRRREYAAAVKRYLSEGLSGATSAAGPSVANQARTIWEKSSPAAAQQLAAYDRFKAAGGRLGTKESQALFSPTFYMPDKATDYDAVASGRAYKDQMAYQAMHRNEGYWDVAGNRPSVLSDNFLTAQIAALNDKITKSKQADEDWKVSGPQQMAAYEKAAQTAERWKQLYSERERGYKKPADWSGYENGYTWQKELAAREYNWLMADYLLGDQAQDWQTYYDEQQARLEGLTDAEWDAEMARYDQQFQGLNWDALMNPQMPTYTSQTDKLTKQLEEHLAEQKYRNNLAAYRDIANKTEGTLNLEKYYAESIEGYDADTPRGEYFTNAAYYINQEPGKAALNIIEALTDGYGESLIKGFTGILTDEDARQVRSYYDKGYDYLLPEEIAIYNDLLSTNADMAAVFLLNMEQQLLARKNAYNTQETALLATDPLLGTMMSATTVMTSPYAAIQTIAGAVGGADAADPIYDLTRDNQTVRQARAQEWAKAMPAEVFGKPIGGTIYNTILSIGDMVMANAGGKAFTGGVSKAAQGAMQAIMSSEVMANTIHDDLQKGYKNEQAVLHGLTNGLIEAWMEQGFMDQLFDAGKGFVPRMLGSALAEGGEEIGTEILQTIGNEFAAYLTGNESEINKVYQYFKNNLPYGSDAGAETLKYYANQFANAGLSGFAMGGGTAALTAGDAIANEIETRQMGADLQQNGDVEAVLQIAESFAEGTEANSAAKSVREELNKRHKVSNRKLGKMITAVTREVGEQNARELNQVLDNSIQERLVELGEDTSNAKKLAPVIRNIYQGRKITRAERAGINWTQNADQVVKEMSGITAEEAEGAQVPGATEAPEGERVGQRWKTQTREKILRTTIDGMGRSAELASALTTKADAAVEGSAKKVQERQKGKPQLKLKEISYIDSTGAKVNGTYEKVVKRNGKLMIAVRDAHNEVVEVEADAIDNAEAGLATIIEHAAHGAKHDMSAEEVNTLAAVYQEKGGDIKAVIRRFEDSYLAGYSGLQRPQGADALDTIAYEQGAKEAAKDEEQRIEKTMRTHRNEKPRVTWLGEISADAEVHGQGDEAALEEEYDNLTEGQQMVAEFSRHLAEQTGLNVVLFRSKARDNGEYTTQNGSYDSATHTIYLDVNAGNLTEKDAAKARKEGTLGYAIMRTMGHEVTHAIEATSPTFYAQYREAVKRELMKAGKDWTGLIRAKLDNAVRNGEKLTYGGAVAEVVADASEYMLQDSAFVNNLDTSLRGKVKAVIKDFAAKIKAAFRNMTGGSAEARALRNDMGQYSERLQKLWDAAFIELQNAGEAYEYPTPIVTDGDRIVDATEVNWQTGDAPMPTYRQFSEEEENAGAFVSYADEADQGTVQHSIRSLSDGTKYVHVDVDQQIFDGLPANEYGKAARNYIRDHFRNKVIGTNVRAYVRRDTENEYTLPAKKNIPPVMYEGKMKAATELDNLLDASVFLGHEEDDGRHPDAVRGWDKYSTVFEVNGRYFEGTVALKKIQKGDVFYDVTKIKDITGPMRAKYSNELQYPGQGDILMDNVPQPDDSVNGNIQKSERVQTEKENPDIRYSHRAGEETEDELYEQYRTISMQLNEAREKKRKAERATGEIREQGVSAFKYSRRTAEPDSASIREMLGGMQPTARMTETEKLLLKRYQEKLAALEEKEKQIEAQEQIIRTAHVPSDELTKAKNRYRIYRDQANRIAKELGEMERNDGFARLMATSQEVVNRFLLGSAGSVADAAEALDEEIADLAAQLKAAEAEVNRAAGGQRTAFARGLFDQKQLEAAAKKLKDAYGSRMSIKNISDRLALAYGELYATKGPEGAQRFMAAAKDLAYDLLKQNKYRYKSDVLELIANEIGVISLSDTDMQEIYSAGLTLSAYKKAVMPYIKVADSGSDLSSYASNAEYYGEGALAALLGDDTEGNLAMRMYNLISAEKAKEREIGYEGMTEEQLLGEAMADIAGVSLPLSQDSKTIDYLRKELLKYAGESDAAAQKIEQAISDARKATQRASGVWVAAVKELETAKAAVTYYRKLEEQRRLTELVEQKQQITEQLKTEYAEKLKKKVEQQRTEFREREQRAREYRHAREDVMKIRRKIGRDVKRLNALRMRATDQKHVPEELNHTADLVMQTFTDSSLARLAFSSEKAASLARRYRLLQELQSDVTYYWDDEIEVEIENLVSLSEAYNAIRERGPGVPSHLSAEGVQLETEILNGVDHIVSNVLRMIDSANDAFLKDRNDTFNEFATKTGEAIRQKDDYKLLKGGWGKAQTAVDELLRMGNVTPVYFMEHLDSPGMMAVFDEIRKGQSDYARIVAEGKTFVEEAKARHHYGAWVADGKLVMETSQKDPKTGKGHTIELTREEAAEIYAIAKREKANQLYQTEHLLYGGFRYKDASKKGSGKTQVSNTPHQLDAADIDKIGRWLTAEQKAYADELVGFLSTNMADYGNAASMAMYGYRKFTEQYYIPFHVAAEQRYQRGDEGPQGEDAGTGRIRNSGFTHKVQHKANATLVVGGLTDTVAEHIHKMATYAALVEPIENMKRLLNHKVMERDGTTNTIRALIGQKYGKASQDYMTNLLKDLNGAANGDERATDLVNRMVGAFKRGAVMASASVVLQQPTAMARAMAYISPKYFAQNPFYRPGKGTWDEMMKYAGTAVIKDMGKFDVGMGLTATQYISDEHLTAMEAYSRLKAESKWEAGKAAYKRALDWLTAAPGMADQWTWGLIWKAVKAEQAALHPGMDQTGEEFLRMCGERFDDVIDHTQVYDSVITRSDLMRSKNEFHKIATSFMSEPTLSINMLYDAVMGKHSGKQRAAIIGSVITSQVLAGAMAALAQAWNDDEDKRNVLERYADRAAGNIRDNLNPLSMIPYASDLMSMLEGYSVERPDMTAIADILSYGKTFFKNAADPEKDLTWKDYENFIGTLANMAGLPAKNISREIRRTRNLILNSQWNAPTGTGMAEALLENVPFYSTKNAAYYERIVAAEMKGDTQKAEDYREYMLLSKMVSEDAMSKGLKAALQEAYIAGRAEEDAAIQYLIKIGAADDENDAWWEVDKWNEMRDEGIAAGEYRKYEEFLQAVETGENLKATIKEYMDHGVSKTALATQITNGFKQRLIDAKKAGKGYADLQARILTAYEALGYDRQKKLKDIQKWLEEP